MGSGTLFDETLIGGDCASLWAQEMVKLGWADGDSFTSMDGELMRQYSWPRLYGLHPFAVGWPYPP
jgi:hypothetical protein